LRQVSSLSAGVQNVFIQAVFKVFSSGLCQVRPANILSVDRILCLARLCVVVSSAAGLPMSPEVLLLDACSCDLSRCAANSWPTLPHPVCPPPRKQPFDVDAAQEREMAREQVPVCFFLPAFRLFDLCLRLVPGRFVLIASDYKLLLALFP
jgi:hypothetical protein